ncbi:transcription termination factor 4, mitochondrial-like isoform X1 [Acanthaster planci]|uniref:Transcription termination factor 4, mitochondrial-like isoform X1 n=1 Tax=Acanthaster planci TaxID=133434 RepID=A0A8B7Z947_ACAPL|nr:transcription termination factor 4, mitochondrial-like isoform X1 [Acanthaster planci]
MLSLQRLRSSMTWQLTKMQLELGWCRDVLGRISSALHAHKYCHQLSLPGQNVRPYMYMCAYACARTVGGKFQLVPHSKRHAALASFVDSHWGWKQSGAFLHSGELNVLTRTAQEDTPKGKDMVTFIRDDNDLERFLGHITDLLSTPDFSKVRIPVEEAKTRAEELVHRLLEMKADPRNIYAFLCSKPRVLSAQQDALMQNLQFLEELRVVGNQALLVLDRNPKVWGADEAVLRDRVRRLRKLGLVEGSLQKVITNWPAILTLRKSRLNGSIDMLRKCQFSGRQITAIVISSPQVLDSQPADIELRFQYVYFTMGLQKQADMVQANLFKYSLEHIRCRHLVLERLGVYQLPSKPGGTRADNPKLCRIVDCTDARFAQKCAGISPEEYETFQRNLEDEAKRDDEGDTEEETDEGFVDYDHDDGTRHTS